MATPSEDLFRLLRERPELRDEMRRLVLTDELLALPQTVAVLAQRVDQLAERMDQLAERMDQLAERMDQLTERLGSLVDQVSEMAGHVEWLKGDAMERRYRERSAAYFGRIARRLHTLTQDELEDLLERAVTERTLTEAEAQEVRLVDAVVRGRRQDADVYLVVEASWGVGIEDVRRAEERAALLAKAGLTTLAIVAGHWINPDARRAAPQVAVWQVANGHVTPPDGVAA